MFTLYLLFACSGGETAAPTPPPAAPEAPAAEALPAPVARALELAKVVQSDPANADAALTGAGSSRDELEKLLFEIAADPKMSEIYAEKMGR